MCTTFERSCLYIPGGNMYDKEAAHKYLMSYGSLKVKLLKHCKTAVRQAPLLKPTCVNLTSL